MATVCDLYVDWHTGSDGDAITDAIAAGSCRPTSPTDTVYASPGATLTRMSIEADSASPVSGLVSVGGVEYDIGDTTQGAIYDHSALVEEFVAASVSSNPAVGSMGFMYKTSISDAYEWWAPCGFYGVYSGGAEWAVIAPRYISGSSIRLYLHTSGGGTGSVYSSTYVSLELNKWYWISIQYNKTAEFGYMTVHDPTTWEQVGSTASLALRSSPGAVDSWSLGCLENQGNTATANTWFGPAVFDFTDGTFPLLPTPVDYSLPTDRTYDWASYCGIPGGIPTRTAVYRTLTTANTASEIVAAISSCPANQVVQLAAGEYTLNLSINSASSCTLRGAGPGSTTINGTISLSGGAIGASADSWSNPRSISSGYTSGSTSITLAATPPASFAVNSNICIVQDDDYDLVWHREGNWAGTHNLRFVSRITSVTTTVNANDTIGLATPIPYTYSAASNPICTATANNVHLFGIEDLTIDGGSILMQGVDRCWANRVEIKNFSSAAAILMQYGNTQCEIRRCYIHDTDPFPPTDDMFCIQLQYNNSCHRIEDNVAARTAQLLVNGSSANYIGYNYIYDTQDGSTWVIAGLGSNHGPHPIMNLWEGNTAQRYQNDGFHGSGSHNTVFRNNIHGTNPDEFTSERQLVDLTRASYYENIVGNILGDSSWNPALYAAVNTASHSLGYVYVLGWGTPDSADGTSDQGVTWTNWTADLPDANVEATIIRHANYDYYNDSVVYLDETTHAIPDSLFYSSKPDWFGDLTWPPIDPFTPTLNDIPAKYRYDAYVESSVLSDIFDAEYAGEGIVSAAGTIAIQSDVLGVADVNPPEYGPSFTLTIEPTTQQVRKPEEAAYFVSATPAGGYTNDITLSVTGMPTGGSYTLDTNPIAYNGSTTLRIDTSGINATDPDAGTDYSLRLVGVEST